MAKSQSVKIDETAKKNVNSFIKNIESEMHYKSDINGDSISFEWVDEIENACMFIDNIVRHPKLTLVQEESVVKAEKSKRITVASIKDLSKHTSYISKIDKKTNDIQPEKILNTRSEETYNIYENRFLYTLLNDLNKFIMDKEDLLNKFEINNNKLLEYTADTENEVEKLSIEVKVTSTSKPQNNANMELKKEIDEVKKRVKRIKEYITSWQRSEMVKALDKAHVAFINPPIKKTNILLKNPNFQIAIKLWDYLLKQQYSDKDANHHDNLDTSGTDYLKDFLNHSFLIDYFILDSVSASKKKQKENISKYAVLLITEEINRILTLLLNNGINIDEDELLKLIAKEMKSEQSTRLVGVDDVKKKFKSVMEEYIERTQDYL